MRDQNYKLELTIIEFIGNSSIFYLTSTSATMYFHPLYIQKTIVPRLSQIYMTIGPRLSTQTGSERAVVEHKE